MSTISFHSFIKVMTRNTLIIGSALLLMLGISGTGPAGEAISVSLDSGGISATAMIADASSVVIRVAGPEDFFAEERSPTGSVYWSLPGGLPDGVYRYDVYVLVGGTTDGEDRDDDSSQMYRENGTFNIQGGQLSDADDLETSGLWQGVTRKLARLVSTVLNVLVPDVHAVDLTASDTLNPGVFFDETDGGSGADWVIGADGDGFLSAPGCDGNTTGFAIFDDVDNNCRKAFEIQDGPNSLNTFIANDIGDISLANSAVFIDRSATFMGIGTTTPAAELHIVQNTAAIRLDDSGTGIWEIGEFANDLVFDDIASNVINVLVLDGNTQNVGVGTSTPTAKLDVIGDVAASFSGANSAGDGLTLLFDMSANNTDVGRVSDVGFLLENAREGFTWSFRTFEPGEGFSMTKIGTGGPEMEIQNTTSDFRNVSIAMGNGATLSSTGQWLDASSREHKENIQDITSAEALDTLKGLNPVKFNFKRDPSKDLNVGFIAEDVPNLVATSDRKTLSPVEIVAVLTKVVQEQQRVISELTGKIIELEKTVGPKNPE